MEKINNEQAVVFYNELLKLGIVEKNEEMRNRLSEVLNGHHALVVLVQHANHFRIKILNKEKLIEVAKKFNVGQHYIQHLAA